MCVYILGLGLGTLCVKMWHVVGHVLTLKMAACLSFLTSKCLLNVNLPGENWPNFITRSTRDSTCCSVTSGYVY